MRIYVLAGSYDQARYWARRLMLEDWRYISEPRDIYGVTGASYIRVGS